MEIDLEDLEFDNDKIKRFLNNKLSEIKSKNENLLQTLGEREEYSSELVRASVLRRSKCTVDASICWKKIFNGKYSLGFRLKNTTKRKFDAYKVFLRWDTKQPLDYTVNIFEDDHSIPCDPPNCMKVTQSLTKSKGLQNLGYLVMTFNLPKFLDKTSYIVTGNILFKCEDEDVITDIPEQQVSVRDITNRETNDFSFIDSDFENLLTLMCTAEGTDLILILPPDWKSSLDSTFEIHCSFTAINISSNCKQYFYSKRISPVLDDILLEIHTGGKMGNELNMTVYTRNTEMVLHLLHHLYSSIQDVIIIPKDLHQIYLLKQNSTLHTSRHRDEDLFRECVDKELDHVENYLHSNGSEDYNNFRNQLASLEQDTDLVYLKLQQ